MQHYSHILVSILKAHNGSHVSVNFCLKIQVTDLFSVLFRRTETMFKGFKMPVKYLWIKAVTGIPLLGTEASSMFRIAALNCSSLLKANSFQVGFCYSEVQSAHHSLKVRCFVGVIIRLYKTCPVGATFSNQILM